MKEIAPLPCFATRICETCKQEKSLIFEFRLKTNQDKGYEKNCRACIRERSAKNFLKRHGKSIDKKFTRFNPKYVCQKDLRDECLNV